MNTAQHLQQLLQIPVTRVTVGDPTRVYSSLDVYAGCIPTVMKADTPQFATDETVLRRFHWETIYIANRAELDDLVKEIFPDAKKISLGSFRHLNVKDADGQHLGVAECIFEGEWRVRKAAENRKAA